MNRTQHGVTLTELLTVVSIAAILMAIGVPTYKSFTTSNRVSGEVNALLADMQFARSEAVKAGQMVTVCPSTSQNQCDANSITWQNGWIVFSDVNANQQVANPASTYILRRQRAFASTLHTFVADSGLGFDICRELGTVVSSLRARRTAARRANQRKKLLHAIVSPVYGTCVL